jgi:hypothetical protein
MMAAVCMLFRTIFSVRTKYCCDTRHGEEGVSTSTHKRTQMPKVSLCT